MKKALSFILALTMVLCMSVTAFAAGGEQNSSTTISVEVPDTTPSYTIHIPANTTLEYGNTGKQMIGDAYVTNATNCDDRVITMSISSTNLTDGNDHTIIMNTFWKFEEHSTYEEIGTSPAELYCQPTNYDARMNIAVQVPSWKNAVQGIYSATITFNFSAVEIPEE